MNNKLIRFWFKFDNNTNLVPLGLVCGCGITAFNYDDALNIMKEKIFKEENIPEIIIKIENVDICTLDQGHVVPNMYSPNYRGIWFPIGYHENKSSV
ncbi:MAG: hypothetical protein ABIP51_11515 [Bacteroidia bacterium]